MDEKPKRLYFKSYLKMIENSVGSNMFRNFYATTPSRGEFDAFNDGEYSCAFFVTAVLVIFKKISGFHGLVSSAVEDLKKSGWQEVKNIKAGDVLVWEHTAIGGESVPHIGFAIGNGRAVSTSWRQRCVAEHDVNFGEENRKIEKVLRMTDWEENDTQRG
jgi:hypothetical protein